MGVERSGTELAQWKISEATKSWPVLELIAALHRGAASRCFTGIVAAPSEISVNGELVSRSRLAKRAALSLEPTGTQARPAFGFWGQPEIVERSRQICAGGMSGSNPRNLCSGCGSDWSRSKLTSPLPAVAGAVAILGATQDRKCRLVDAWGMFGAAHKASALPHLDPLPPTAWAGEEMKKGDRER